VGTILLTGSIAIADSEKINSLNEHNKTLPKELINKEEHSALQKKDEKAYLIPKNILDHLEFGFLMEAEGFYARSEQENESDLTLATVEFVADATFSEGVSGHLGLLWEEDDTEENILDEGFISFGATDSIPFYGRVGKMYLPFGNFESAFISDPLTLEMGEINQSALLAGYENQWLNLCVGTFNGDFSEDGREDTIDDWVASISFTPSESVAFGAYFISDLLDTDGFEGFATGLGTEYESISGGGMFFNANFGAVTFNAECVSAMEEIKGLRPFSYNVEASISFAEKWIAGIKIGGSNDFYTEYNAGSLEGKMPDWRSGMVISYELNDFVTFSGEYLHAEGLDHHSSSDTITMQVAVGF